MRMIWFLRKIGAISVSDKMIGEYYKRKPKKDVSLHRLFQITFEIRIALTIFMIAATAFSLYFFYRNYIKDVEIFYRRFFIMPVLVLILLLAIFVVCIGIFKLSIYYKTKKQSVILLKKINYHMQKGEFEEVIKTSSAAEYKNSALAKMTAAGIKEFLKGQAKNLSFEEQIETAQSGMDKASTIFTQELKSGLNTLATIATSAPFIGLFGTIFGIINAFRSNAQTGSAGIGIVATGIAKSLITTGAGLLVAVAALLLFNALSKNFESYSRKVGDTSSQILCDLIKSK